VWTLGQTTDPEEVKKIMQTNLKGELVEKSSSKYFIKDYGI
jgi:glutamyl-tRNA(Gln) amidotransferase subunit D